MARAEKTKGAPFSYSRGYALTQEQKDCLLELLGVDTEDLEDESRDIERELQCIYCIEQYLGAFEGIKEATDNAPRPANYRTEIESLREKTYDLLQDCIQTSYWMNEYFTNQGMNFSDFKHNLAGFFDASTIMLQNLENKESRGKPQNIALKILVNTLQKIFEEYYLTPPLDEDNLNENDKSDRRNLSGKEIDEINFIKACLEFRKILPPTNIRAYLYNSETPQDEKLFIGKS